MSTVLHLPARRPDPDAPEVELELRRLENGQLALLAFSDLDRLVAGCGPAQPWVGVPADRIDEVQQQASADVVLLDVPLPDALRHGGEVW